MSAGGGEERKGNLPQEPLLYLQVPGRLPGILWIVTFLISSSSSMLMPGHSWDVPGKHICIVLFKCPFLHLGPIGVLVFVLRG